MKTPICDFIERYAASDAVRAHMPGHKGKELLGMERLDITEMSGADSLFKADGIIAESERNLTSIFDTGSSLYSCEGSSLCVRAMMYLARLNAGEERGYILAGRNAHSSLISAAALLDFDIEWLYPSDSEAYLKCEITPAALEKRLGECEKKPFCVYITSPDYLGNIADIGALSEICDRYGVLLVVDNAHGAYLKFLDEDIHPITLGAHMCCDSAHKTLPALTGGAYLHISKRAPKIVFEYAKDAMSLFASTSPSYLILSSLDRVNKYLDCEYRSRLLTFKESITSLKARLTEDGYDLLGDEVLKIVINARSRGYSGHTLARALEEKGIYCEFCDGDFLVLMLTPETTSEELNRIENALLSIPASDKMPAPVVKIEPPEVKMSIREAIMSQKTRVPISQSLGRVSASVNVICPPAVSLIVAGEVYNESVISALKYYGFEHCDVVK